ncbi:protein STRUBBELIG-RECEPTOR FAMILY 6-like [Lycium ferocissimum]|uniref:protein STRUBBELIG-RECEPTOR FAMILY 6-like n=1 Tax=Lycium ferocissimum TaxID=112874 RepID=UPI00281609AF|nr:protein STRUBBELIG-RECEPTOR FAMILY 6-like [Lycium ferocissimum]
MWGSVFLFIFKFLKLLTRYVLMIRFLSFSFSKIAGLGLSGSMGYQLVSLKSVTDFDISNNNIGGIQLPYQLPPNVQRLNLADSSFSGGLPRSISQLTSLQYLNVSHNKIQGSVIVSFDSISALNTLDFSFNSMRGNLPQSFQSLTSMNKIKSFRTSIFLFAELLSIIEVLLL